MLTYFFMALICAIVVFATTYDYEWKDWFSSTVYSLICGAIFYWIFWLFMPDTDWSSGNWIIFPCLAFIVGVVINIMFDSHSVSALVVFVVALLSVIGYWISTSEVFHYNKYRKMLNVTEVADSVYRQDFVPIEPTNMIKVDLKLASKYASAVLEQNVSIGSVCEVNSFYRIRLHNNLTVTLATGESKTLNLANQVVYVAPLEHRSFWKWQSKHTTPGYILVSAQRQNEVYFVTAVNGEQLNLRYLKSACFADNLERHVRKNGYSSGVTNFSFVLDPSGRPFATATIYHRSVGFSGKVPDGVLTIDVQTGEICEYGLDNAPAWVDRIYPREFIRDYINDWGEYPDGYGYWNSIFSQNEVRMATPGMTAVYNNGERYFYTGIQSAGADDGTSGVMMINSRTGEAKIYAIKGGANEASTQAKFETYKIDAAEVHASDVIIYPVKNENLYFATLTGNTGEFLGYGVASVKSRDIAAVGKTVDEALKNYYIAKHSANQDSQLVGEAEQVEETLLVKDIVCEKGIYYLLFADKPHQEFMAPAELSGELRWTKPGHQVKLIYAVSAQNELSVMVDGFENLSFEL